MKNLKLYTALFISALSVSCAQHITDDYVQQARASAVMRDRVHYDHIVLTTTNDGIEAPINDQNVTYYYFNGDETLLPDSELERLTAFIINHSDVTTLLIHGASDDVLNADRIVEITRHINFINPNITVDIATQNIPDINPQTIALWYE